MSNVVKNPERNKLTWRDAVIYGARNRWRNPPWHRNAGERSTTPVAHLSTSPLAHDAFTSLFAHWSFHIPARSLIAILQSHSVNDATDIANAMIYLSIVVKDRCSLHILSRAVMKKLDRVNLWCAKVSPARSLAHLLANDQQETSEEE